MLGVRYIGAGSLYKKKIVKKTNNLMEDDGKFLHRTKFERRPVRPIETESTIRKKKI